MWALLAGAPRPVAAGQGTITLSITADTEVGDGEVRCTVRVRNTGNEPAQSVQVEAELGGERVSSPESRTLAPDGELTEILVFADVPERGRHAIPLYVRYADARLHPFTAPAYAWVVVEVDPNPGMALRLDPVELGDDQAIATAVLTSESSEERTVRLRLVLPDEIEASAPERELVLGPGESRRETFRLRNVSAVVGSRYPVIGLLESAGGRPHRAVAATGTVSIVEAVVEPEEPSARRLSAVVLAVLIAAVFAVGWAIRARSRPAV